MARDNVEPGLFEFGNDGPSLIIAGVDGSDTSLRATAFAGGLARREGSRLVCVFVSAPPMFAAMAPGAVAATLPDEIADDLRQRLEEGASYHGLRVELIVRHGDPFAELTRVADELRADMVVVGASTHAGHRLIGSLAVRLVRAGRWPVTVVP
jgi:nucleotide-binding universal stress UspA family protein